MLKFALGEVIRMAPKVDLGKNQQIKMDKFKKLLEDFQEHYRRVQQSVAICNICKKKFNFWTGEPMPQHSQSFHVMLPENEPVTPATPRMMNVSLPRMQKSAPEVKQESLEHHDKYGIPCQAINPGRKKRIPEPSSRVTRSMVNKKFKQNEGIALNPGSLQGACQ